MCNCGKRRVAIPGTGPGFGGGARGLPAARALPTTVAPMPSAVAVQPRRIQQVRRAVASPRLHVVQAPVMTSVAPPSVAVAEAPRAVPIPSPPSRLRGGGGVAASADPAVWGPHAWYILHTLAELAFRDPNGSLLDSHWASLVSATAESLPCPTCARHFRTWMSWVPFEASVAAATVRARFAELHNMVNRTNRVPEWSGDLATVYTGSADDVRARIISMRGILGAPMLDAADAMLDLLAG